MESSESKNNGNKLSVIMLSSGLSIGTGLGISLGVVFDNIPLGLSMGAGVGLVIGLALSNFYRSKTCKEDQSS